MAHGRLSGLLMAFVACAGAVRAGDPTEMSPVPGSFILSSLTPQAAAPEGSAAFARIDIAKDGTQSFVVRVLGLPPGDYEAWAGGTFLGTFPVGADGLGQLAPAPSPFGYFEWFQYQLTVRVRQAG